MIHTSQILGVEDRTLSAISNIRNDDDIYFKLCYLLFNDLMTMLHDVKNDLFDEKKLIEEVKA